MSVVALLPGIDIVFQKAGHCSALKLNFTHIIFQMNRNKRDPVFRYLVHDLIPDLRELLIIIASRDRHGYIIKID